VKIANILVIVDPTAAEHPAIEKALCLATGTVNVVLRRLGHSRKEMTGPGFAEESAASG